MEKQKEEEGNCTQISGSVPFSVLYGDDTMINMWLFNDSIGSVSVSVQYRAVADPGFPIGGIDLIGGCGLLRWLCFLKFVCQNERIGSLRGAHAGCTP